MTTDATLPTRIATLEAENARLRKERGEWEHQCSVNLEHYEAEKRMRRRAEARSSALRDAVLAMLRMYGPPEVVAEQCEYPADHPISLSRAALASQPDAPVDVAEECARPDEIAAAWKAWHARHGGKLGPGPAFVEAIKAAFAVRFGKGRT